MRNHFATIRTTSLYECLKRLQHLGVWTVVLSAMLIGLTVQSNALAISGETNSDSLDSVVLNAPHAVSYALFMPNGNTLFSGELDDLDDMKAVAATQRPAQGEYLVVRRGKQNYYIDDAALLTKIKNEWKPLEPIEQEMEQLGAQMEQLELGLEIYQEELETYLEVEGEVDEVFMAEFEARHKTFEQDIKPVATRMEILGKKIETLSHKAHTNVLKMIEKVLDSGAAKKLS